MSFWSSKKDCRAYFKSLIVQGFAQGLIQNQQQIDFHLRGFLASQVGIWGAYRALVLEAKVDIFSEVPQIRWAFPRIKDGELEFCESSAFVVGPYGIHEPAASAEAIEVGQLQGLLVPGLAFNKNGNRLGRGQGYYDKALQNFSGLKVGICFDFQLSKETLPTEAHDIRVDYLITESGLIDCKMF